MISVSCPSCGDTASVVRRGLNRNGTQRCLCNKCHKTFTLDPKPRRVSSETVALIENALAERISQRGIAPNPWSQPQYDYRGAKKRAERIIELGLPQLEEPPAEEVVEYDEICVRKSPSLWLWLAISRQTRVVLGFVLADRSDAAFDRLRNEEIPPAYWDVPSCSDGWEAYRKMLSSDVHTICDKGSGKQALWKR